MIQLPDKLELSHLILWLNKSTTDFNFVGNFCQFFCCMFPMLSLLFRFFFFFSVKTSHKSFQQECAEVREGVNSILMPDVVL